MSELKKAVKNNDKHKVESLLKAGANPNIEDIYGRTPLHYSKSFKISKILLESNADVSIRDKYGCTPIHVCKTYNILKLLINSGGDINMTDADIGMKIIQYWGNNSNITELLINHNADTNINIKKPLHFIN